MCTNDHQRLEPKAVDEAEEFVFLARIGATRVDDNTILDVFVIDDVGVFREGIKDKGFELEHKYCFDTALRQAQGPLRDMFFGAKVGIFPQHSKDFAYLCRLIWD